jgi:glycosyltransferase involved in cell wall biosynthesis/predicted Zn-dependent protease
LAKLTGDLAHYHEAALARPDLAVSRAALARAGRHAEALPHLRRAVADAPFDGAAARALYGVLGETRDAAGQRRVARDRRLLAEAAPQAVPAEPWFAQAGPAGDELASIIVLCCNQLDFSRLCLESVLRHTHGPYELVIVDNGSTDATPAYLEGLRGRPGPERVVVLRNEQNRGFAAGCNQALAEARGDYLVLLNNDTVVAAGWLEGLVRWALHDWPQAGLVGPVSNYTSPPQLVEVDYAGAAGIDAFAERRARDYAGRALTTERLTGFCLLFRRDVLEKVGLLDERFGLGFFEDDDLGVRVRQAGFRLVVALDVFVHHFDSRTFAGLGLDAHRQLQDNFALFKDKWGEEHARGYRLPQRPTPGGEEALPRARPRVSLTMIVKNEEAHLADCLASVADLVDEMVVVDTGSTDRTKEVAEKAGARVYDFAWQDSFAAARNEALRHATSDWVLWLDADERLDEKNREKLRALLAGLPGENVAYVMRQRSPLEDAPHAAADVDQVRLFRAHPDLRWEHRVHEQVLPCLRRLGTRLAQTDIVIAHGGFAAPDRQGAKVERNRRLLELAERPDDAFALYNLGAVELTRDRAEEAVGHLRRSLQHSHARDTLVPKLYALLTRAQHQLGQKDEALAACRQGLALHAGDPELLFWEALLLRERGDLAGCERCLLEVLRAPAGRHFMSSDAGLRGYRTRHLLAEVYRGQGRLAEAEAQWRAAVAECPGFTPAWRELAGLCLAQGRWAELEEALESLRRDPRAAAEADVLQARAHLGRREFAACRELLQACITRAPRALEPRIVPSYALLQEGANPAAAEQALRAILELDPGNTEAAHNLRVLLGEQGRAAAPAPAGRRLRVSLSMIVRNEEDNLPACLESVAGLVDEMVVVDTGSTDATREVAARHGARVFNFAWCDNFAAARNESLRHASGDWALWLDADEYLDEDNRRRLRDLLAGLKDERAAYVMTQRSATPAGSAMRVQQVRLFRRTPGANTPGSPRAVRWEYRVHEQLLPSLRRAGFAVRPTDVVIEHSGYRDPAAGPAKLARNLRLLLLDQAERPDDPFTLFNLGAAYLEQGNVADAVPLLERSLGRSQPGDSIVPKLYAALAGAHQRLGQRDQALAVLRQGRVRCPGAPALLFLEGQLRQAGGDAAGAAEFYRQLLQPDDPEEGAAGPVLSAGGVLFADADEGLPRSARHQLALACRAQGRADEAERLWRGLLAAQPDFLPAWLGLGELFLAGQRWDDLEEAAARLEAAPAGGVEALVLRGRARLARGDFAGAHDLLGQALARAPGSVPARVYLTHVLLQEGRDPAAAERALRELVALDPSQSGAWRNLAVLLRHGGRLPEALAVCQSARARAAGDPDLLLLHGMLLHEAGDLVNAEACLAGLLEQEAAAAGASSGERGRSRRVTARRLLSYVLLDEDQDRPAAEAALRDLLARDPADAEARHNLAVFGRRQGRPLPA